MFINIDDDLSGKINLKDVVFLKLPVLKKRMLSVAFQIFLKGGIYDD